jgi:hypothetical protein
VRRTETTDEVRRILASLITERLELRRQDTNSMLIEANAIAIEYWQDRLRHQQRVAGPGADGAKLARRPPS